MGETDEFGRRVEDIVEKLEAGETLDASDVGFVLTHAPDVFDGRLDGYSGAIDEAIAPEIGHAVYSLVVWEFVDAGVVDGLRTDLLDPSADPEGFERRETTGRTYYPSIRIGEAASEGVGYIHPPEKRPATLWRLRESVRRYLYCCGKGFHFDPEMIYDYETDYREFLRAVLDCADGLGAYALTVDCDDDGRSTTIDVSLRVDGQSYRQTFAHGTDWLRFDVLGPVEAALETVGQTVHYHGAGNDGWVLVVGSDADDLVSRYVW